MQFVLALEGVGLIDGSQEGRIGFSIVRFLDRVEVGERVFLRFKQRGVDFDRGRALADGGLAETVAGCGFDEVDLVVVVLVCLRRMGGIVGLGRGGIGDGVAFGAGVLVLEDGLVEVDVRHFNNYSLVVSRNKLCRGSYFLSKGNLRSFWEGL